MKRLLLPITVLLVLALASITCASQKQVAKVGPIAVNVLLLDLQVNVTPTSATRAETEYVVELYEKGNLRDTSTVTWSTVELNVREEKYVYFPLTHDEVDAYMWKDLSDIFSAKVHE
jgi:hypothetical protein